jgi:ribosomal protein L7/L12
MNALWSVTIDQYFEIIQRAKDAGLKPGDDMTKIFKEYMAEQGLKPIGHTELTKDELAKEYASHNKKTLDISHNSEGVPKIQVIKAKDNIEE